MTRGREKASGTARNYVVLCLILVLMGGLLALTMRDKAALEADLANARAEIATIDMMLKVEQIRVENLAWELDQNFNALEQHEAEQKRLAEEKSALAAELASSHASDCRMPSRAGAAVAVDVVNRLLR